MPVEIRYRCSNHAVAKGRQDSRRLQLNRLFLEALAHDLLNRRLCGRLYG